MQIYEKKNHDLGHLTVVKKLTNHNTINNILRRAIRGVTCICILSPGAADTIKKFKIFILKITNNTDFIM